MSVVLSTKEKSADLAKTGLVEQCANQIVMKRQVLNASDEGEVTKNVNLPKESAQTNVKGQLNEGDLEKAHQSADLLQCGVVIPLRDDIARQKEEGSHPKNVRNPQREDRARRRDDPVLWTDGPAPRTTEDHSLPIDAPSLPNDLRDADLPNEGVPLRENAHRNVDVLLKDKDLRTRDAPPKDKGRQKEDAPSRDSARRLEEGAEKKDKVRTRGPTCGEAVPTRAAASTTGWASACLKRNLWSADAANARRKSAARR
jgi:hypothetical protein